MREINITFTTADVSLYKDVLIRQGENLASQLLLNIPSDMLGYQYILVFKINSDTPIFTTEQFPVNGVITYDVTSVLTNYAGDLKIELHAYENLSLTNQRLIKSAMSKLRITPALDATTEVAPEDYIPWYTQVLEMYEEVVDIEDHVDTVYDEIVTDEQARVVAEGLRVIAEGNRVSAEALRVSAESSRVGAEEDRVTAEGLRDTAEGLREDGEDARNVFELYVAETTYVVNNKVSYEGSSYVCILESTGNLPTNPTYWLLIAARGIDGEDGADGTQADWNATEGLAVILNKPTIPTIPSIVNNLTTETTGSTLDATQGKVLNDKITTVRTATITATWVGSAAPYTQDVTVSGLTANDRPIITPVYSSTLATALLEAVAWGQITFADSGTDKITFTCNIDKPVTAISIEVKGV